MHEKMEVWSSRIAERSQEHFDVGTQRTVTVISVKNSLCLICNHFYNIYGL